MTHPCMLFLFLNIAMEEIPSKTQNHTEHLLSRYSLVLSALLLANCLGVKLNHLWGLNLVPVIVVKIM